MEDQYWPPVRLLSQHYNIYFFVCVAYIPLLCDRQNRVVEYISKLPSFIVVFNQNTPPAGHPNKKEEPNRQWAALLLCLARTNRADSGSTTTTTTTTRSAISSLLICIYSLDSLYITIAAAQHNFLGQPEKLFVYLFGSSLACSTTPKNKKRRAPS